MTFICTHPLLYYVISAKITLMRTQCVPGLPPPPRAEGLGTRLEYGSAIWDCNKSQTRALESIILGGAKKILGCSSKTCNEAVWGDMGLKSRRDRAKLKWWFVDCRIIGTQNSQEGK